MSLLLHIETATKVCSVALSENDKILLCKETNIENSHSSILTTYIQDIIIEAGKSFNDIDAVSVSKGPGSYTGLRIGVSAAKGICFAIDKPLISVNTLETMSYGFIETFKKELSEETLLCPMIDARRMEVYAAVFNHKLQCLRSTQADIVTENTYLEFVENNKVCFFGDGAFKCTEVLRNWQNAFIYENFFPSARFLAKPSYLKFCNKEFEYTAYFEPYYLKDFVAGKARVKGLN